MAKKVKILNSATLRRWLKEAGRGAIAHQPVFIFDTIAFEAALEEVVRQHPEENEPEARTAYRLLTLPEPVAGPSVPKPHRWAFWLELAWKIIVFFLLSFVAVQLAHAQAPSGNVVPSTGGGVIIQFRNAGTPLATRPAGLVAIDCSTGMDCSFSGGVFTLTSTSTGATAWSAITAGTNTNALLVGTGGTFGPTGTGTITATNVTPAGTLDNCVKWGSGGTLADFGSACGGSGSPGGSNGQIQFNSSSAFAGAAPVLAEAFAGADWCAKVQAADTALGAGEGEIWMTQAAGTSACAADITLSADHTLRFVQPGDYSIGTHSILIGGNNIAVIGSANGGTIIRSTTTTGTVLADSAATARNNILIQGLEFNSDGGAGNTATGINFTGFNNSNFKNLSVNDFGTQIFCNTTGSPASYYNVWDRIEMYASSASSGFDGLKMEGSCNANWFYGLKALRLDEQIILGNASASVLNDARFYAASLESADTAAVHVIKATSIGFFGPRLEALPTGFIADADNSNLAGTTIDAPHMQSVTTPYSDSVGAFVTEGTGLGPRVTVASGLGSNIANLAPNGRFESWTSSTDVLGWTAQATTTWGGSENYQTQESTVHCGASTQCTVHTGSYSVKFGDGATTNKGIAWSSAIAIDPTKPYTTTFWVGSNNAGSDYRYAFQLKDSAGATITTGTVYSLCATTGDVPSSWGSCNLTYSASWTAHVVGSDQSLTGVDTLQRRSMILRFPAGTATVRFGIFTRASAGFYGYLDDFYFGEGEAPTYPNERPSTTTLTDFSPTTPNSSGQIPIWDNSQQQYVPGDPLVQGLTAHDAAGASTNPVAVGGYASAAAPADVSADTDIVRAWFLRNGAQASVLTAAGALIGGDATNGLDVDVTRVQGTVAVTQSGTWDEVGINDSGNSITVDNPALSVVGGGAEATALRVTIANDSTGVVSVDDNGGSLTVDGTVTVTDGAGALNVICDSGCASGGSTTPADNFANPTTAGLSASFNMVYDGATWDMLRGTSADGMLVNLGANNDVTVTGSVAVTNAGTFAVQESGAALTALQLIDNLPVAQGSTTSGQSGALVMGAVTTSAPSYTTAQTSPLSLTTSGELRVAGTFNAGIVQVNDDADAQQNVGYFTGDLNMPTQNVTDGADDAAFTAATDWVTVVGCAATADAVDANDRAALACDTSRNLKVSQQGTVTVTATNLDVQIGGSDSLTIGTMANLTESLVDDAAFTPATSRVLPVGFEFDDTTPDSVNEGDIGAARMSANRNIYTTIRDAAGNERGVNVTASNELSVNCGNCTGSGASALDDSAFTATSDDVAPTGLLYDTTPPTITDGNVGLPRMDSNRYAYVNCVVGCAGGATTPADNFANPTTAGLSASFNMVYDGANWDMLRGTSVDGMLVNLGANNDVTVTGSVAVTNAGTFAVQESGAALTSLQLLDDTVFTDDTSTHATGTTKGIGIMATATPTDTAVNANDIGMLAMSLNRELLTSTAVTSIAAGDNNIGNVDVVTMPTVTVTATNLDVQIGGSDSLTIGTFPDNEPFNVAQKGGTAIVGGPCETEQHLFIQISQTANTQLITGTASERIYICSLQIVTATAQNIALVDGTGSTCGTGPTGLLGGSTAATGWNFAANGGIAMPVNVYGWTKTSTDADNVCLLQSGSGQVSGSLSYVSRANM